MLDPLTTQVSPHDQKAGLYALDSKPMTVDEAIDRMHFNQHSLQSRLQYTSYHAVKSVVVGKVTSEGDRKAESEIQELGSRIRRPSHESMTCLPRWRPGPRTSQSFRNRKIGISGENVLLSPWT